jgi:PadR family transcriptional regulator PadR
VLLAILRLGESAYGVTIRDEIRKCTERDPAPGALYTTFDRLERKGFVSAKMGAPTPERGGRAKRFYRVSARGLKALGRAQRAYRRLMSGIEIPGVASA